MTAKDLSFTSHFLRLFLQPATKSIPNKSEFKYFTLFTKISNTIGIDNQKPATGPDVDLDHQISDSHSLVFSDISNME